MRIDKYKLWPEMILLMICAIWLLGGISQKEGYHMDELLSFELANAKFNPWIVPTQPQGRLAKFVENEVEGENLKETIQNLKGIVLDVIHNRGNSKLLTYKADVYEQPVWITAEQFKEYITVSKDDAFEYASVYFNVKDDNHPPLHFMILHTVCSFFQGKINPYMGCGINLVCVIGIMLLLFWMGRRVSLLLGCPDKGRLAGFWAAALYGFSSGAMSTTLLIRMYGMVSFWCAALLAIHLNKLSAPRLRMRGQNINDFRKKNSLLILVTVCGFWTQYFFLFYCFSLAAVTVIILWRMDRTTEVWHYIRSMMLAAVIGLFVFPFAVGDVFSSGRGVEALSNLSSGLAGYGTRVLAFGRILVQETGTGTVLVGGIAVLIVLFQFFRSGKRIVSREVVCLLTVPVVVYFLLAARMSPYMVDRYIMPVFPMVVLLAVLAISGLVAQRTVLILAVLTLLIQPLQTIQYGNPYLYQGYRGQLEIAERYAESPCICIGNGVGYYENLQEFACYERTLILTPEEFGQMTDSVRELSNVVVLLKTGVDRDGICNQMKQFCHMEMKEVLLPRGGAHDDEILYFQSCSD